MADDLGKDRGLGPRVAAGSNLFFLFEVFFFFLFLPSFFLSANMFFEIAP